MGFYKYVSAKHPEQLQYLHDRHAYRLTDKLGYRSQVLKTLMQSHDPKSLAWIQSHLLLAAAERNDVALVNEILDMPSINPTYAAKFSINWSISPEMKRKLLLHSKTDIYRLFNGIYRKESILHLALYEPDSLELISQRSDFNPNKRWDGNLDNDNTLLMLAAAERDLLPALKIILNHPATDVNAVSRSGETAFTKAALRNNLQGMDLIGADRRFDREKNLQVSDSVLTTIVDCHRILTSSQIFERFLNLGLSPYYYLKSKKAPLYTYVDLHGDSATQQVFAEYTRAPRHRS
jgi:hypothetical protein